MARRLRPPAEKGSPLDKVYDALLRVGSVWEGDNSQDWQCPAHEDNRASLGVREGDRSPVVLFCQAGCEPSDILTALGLTWADAYFDDRGVQTMRGVISSGENAKPRQRRTGGGSRNTAAKPTVAKHTHDANCTVVRKRQWSYTDEDDNVLTTVYRTDYSCGEGKFVRQRGGRARKVLYRLADVAQQVKAVGQVVLVEGEPSVDAALSAGWERPGAGRKRSMVVTTLRGGAGKPWPESHTAALKGASRVVIVADRDQPGYQHARVVARALKAAGIPVSVVRSATTGDKDDLVEHIEAGGTFETLERVSLSELRRLATESVDADKVAPATTGWSNAADEANTWPPPGDPRSIALYFRDQQFRDNEGRLLLKHWRGDFYTWTGSYWQVLPMNELESLLEEQLHDAVYLKPVKVEDGQPEQWEKMPMLVNTSRIKDIMHFLANIGIVSNNLEAPTWLDGSHEDAGLLVAMQNGLLDVDSHKLTEHSPAYFNLNALPFAYEERAQCLEWLSFLDTIWSDDPKSIRLLQEIFGLLVSGETRYNKIVLIVGPPRSGKGTIGKTIEAVIGTPSIGAPQLASLAKSNFALQPLLGKSVALIGDARFSGAGAADAVSRLLTISGDDVTTVDRKGRESWTGRLGVRFVIMSNEPPSMRDQAGALASRMLMLRMVETFLGREDLSLFDRIKVELPGILNWALLGLDRLRKREVENAGSGNLFTRPLRSVKAEREMVRLTSPVSAFVEDRCKLDPAAKTPTSSMWAAWRDYSKEHGEYEGSHEQFGRALLSAFPMLDAKQARTVNPRQRGVDNRQRHYFGIWLDDPDGVFS